MSIHHEYKYVCDSCGTSYQHEYGQRETPKDWIEFKIPNGSEDYVLCTECVKAVKDVLSKEEAKEIEKLRAAIRTIRQISREQKVAWLRLYLIEQASWAALGEKPPC